jgi:hypothetical protein
MTTKIALSFLILTLRLASPASGTVIIPADLGELSHDALAIVRGRVAAVDPHWTADRRTIETIVTLEVESSLKGAFGPTMQFSVPGGELGRFRSIVIGAPTFAVDEHIVVFLGARGPSVLHVVGFSQGVFRVVRAADNTGWRVTPPAILPSAAGSIAIVKGDPSRVPLALDDFERRVRGLVGGAK